MRLVHLRVGFIRKVSSEYAIHSDDHTGFADGYPILLTSEEGLQDLNSRLDTAVPMNCFRPNLVVKGCEPFAEDYLEQNPCRGRRTSGGQTLCPLRGHYDR